MFGSDGGDITSQDNNIVQVCVCEAVNVDGGEGVSIRERERESYKHDCLFQLHVLITSNIHNNTALQSKSYFIPK